MASRRNSSFPPQKVERLLLKHGRRNVKAENLPDKFIKFTKDIVHTLVEMPWRKLLFIVIMTFFTTWTFFGIVYYVIAWTNGDLVFDEITGERMIGDRDPCIMGARTFAGFFLHSVESQVSTGYGTWYPSEECPSAITALITQLVFGLIIDSAIVGIVIQKLTRPPKHVYKEFSKHAVICLRDDKYCLLFRIADFRHTRSIDSKIRAYLFEDVLTEENYIEKRQSRLKIEESGRLFMLWPQIACHIIDKNSPLYRMGPRDFAEMNFEIIIGHKGESSYSGHTTQARTSYLAREVLWGFRFVNITSFDDENECFVADVDAMDDIKQVEMPQYSAKVYDQLKTVGDGNEIVWRSELRRFDVDMIESAM
ncbi:unnamed protein product [Chironomus riparius]|uniref:Uncharacterized protein n=1 Tax=Chironomus riparius TaxID=315576 RepID=A0A9N9S7S2_9DIPT|nr:unnamed protein product [Chironomus riparius]